MVCKFQQQTSRKHIVLTRIAFFSQNRLDGRNVHLLMFRWIFCILQDLCMSVVTTSAPRWSNIFFAKYLNFQTFPKEILCGLFEISAAAGETTFS